MRLIVAGGGTGGHLFPGIAVAEEFLARDASNEVLFVGTELGIEARVLPRLQYRLECIATTGMRGKNRLSQLKGAVLLLKSYFQSKKILHDFAPDIVLGVGGYASGPLMLAARRLRCKRFIHEQNAVPGFTNKKLAGIVDKVFLSLEESSRFFPKDKTLVTGNPLRKEILQKVQQDPLIREQTDTFKLLVFGGSAGAHSINMAMLEALPLLCGVSHQLAIVHQTGDKDLNEVQEAYVASGLTAETHPFIHNMAEAYHWADLVICRAGATTLAEITACGKACIFIPFPYATDDHQRKNAEALVEKGAGFMLLNRDLTGESLAKMLLELMADPDKLHLAGERAATLARPEAARIIVDAMLKKTGTRIEDRGTK
jgi:UDP-N-acetylglucosamine--N-acetylmuramyl-(pentapeptide) pyrophosphoryl-undecaprenol N-acetylglucosamine transferase